MSSLREPEVAGSGIVGFVAVTALAERAHFVTLIERRLEIRNVEVVGMVLQSNALAALAQVILEASIAISRRRCLPTARPIWPWHSV